MDEDEEDLRTVCGDEDEVEEEREEVEGKEKREEYDEEWKRESKGDNLDIMGTPSFFSFMILNSMDSLLNRLRSTCLSQLSSQ